MKRNLYHAGERVFLKRKINGQRVSGVIQHVVSYESGRAAMIDLPYGREIVDTRDLMHKAPRDDARAGRCVCGMLVRHHYDERNRKLSCEDTAAIKPRATRRWPS